MHSALNVEQKFEKREQKMQKTKLRISVGLLGAVVYFGSLFGGYVASLLLTGYILLIEENEWLRKSAVKAVILLICFSVISTLIYLLPDAINFISEIVSMFGGAFYVSFISGLAGAAYSAMNIIERLLFIGLGIKALNQGTIAVPIVDKLIEKYMG